MGKLQTFHIQLSNPQAVYQSGNWLEGSVIVVLNDAMKMRGIHLKFTGKADVHWTERHTTGSGDNRRTETRHYRASEVYFDQSVVLFGKNQGEMSGENPTLPAGSYSYPFKFQLPSDIPSSFEGAHGNVRYTLKGTIDKPWKFDHTCKAVFSVLHHLDLNQVPTAGLPIEGSDEKMICCLCCASGPITAHIKLSRQGFVPGEYIYIDASIDNASNRKIDHSGCDLIQTIKFKATSKTRSLSEVVARLKRDAVPEHGNDAYMNIPLLIPPVPPSDLLGCNIIDVKYTLKFYVDPSGPATDLEIPFPITIGTIPLTNVFASYAQTAYNAQQYGDPNIPQVPPSLPPPSSNPAPSAPPPSYAEVLGPKYNIKEDGDSDYTQGLKDFAPVYPYYTWETPSAPPMPSTGAAYGVQPAQYSSYPPPGDTPANYPPPAYPPNQPPNQYPPPAYPPNQPPNQYPPPAYPPS